LRRGVPPYKAARTSSHRSARVTEPLTIDGAHGEAGGQIVRTALALAVITGRPIRLLHIRAGRRNPGLAAQHITAVHAAARLCAARVEGAMLGSQMLDFVPLQRALAGDYLFDVAQARPGGSAGATMLVLQTVLLPLALAEGASSLVLRGGTHVTASPPFDFIRDVWLPMLQRMGVDAELELHRTGWYPVGQGEAAASVRGSRAPLTPIALSERGELLRVRGRALAANLPAHIPQRMADRARALLERAGIRTDIRALRVEAACPGAGIFLTAEYGNCYAGFSALGERGKPSEAVAEEACLALLAHRDSGAALDEHLADQMVLPAALAAGESVFSVAAISPHLLTNAWVVEQFGLARVRLEPGPAQGGTLTIQGRGLS
jgi:RNA 3'-terminal phosphate cyclase (ATP)